MIFSFQSMLLLKKCPSVTMTFIYFVRRLSSLQIGQDLGTSRNSFSKVFSSFFGKQSVLVHEKVPPKNFSAVRLNFATKIVILSFGLPKIFRIQRFSNKKAPPPPYHVFRHSERKNFGLKVFIPAFYIPRILGNAKF